MSEKQTCQERDAANERAEVSRQEAGVEEHPAGAFGIAIDGIAGITDGLIDEVASLREKLAAAEQRAEEAERSRNIAVDTASRNMRQREDAEADRDRLAEALREARRWLPMPDKDKTHPHRAAAVRKIDAVLATIPPEPKQENG